MDDSKYNLISKQGCRYRIIEKINYEHSIIEFADGYTKRANHNTDSIRNPYFPNLLGIGYIGEGKYKSSTHKKSYKTWSSMLERCYDGKNSTYKDVTVCEEWKCFQNFAEWFENNYNFETMHKWCLDKDLLSKCVKVYSPKTCCFLPAPINALLGFIHSDLKVTKIKNRYYTRIMIAGKRASLKVCDTKEEAFELYICRRKEQSLNLLLQYRDQLSPEIVKSIETLIDSIDSNVNCIEFESLVFRKKD